MRQRRVLRTGPICHVFLQENLTGGWNPSRRRRAKKLYILCNKTPFPGGVAYLNIDREGLS